MQLDLLSRRRWTTPTILNEHMTYISNTDFKKRRRSDIAGIAKYRPENKSTKLTITFGNIPVDFDVIFNL